PARSTERRDAPRTRSARCASPTSPKTFSTAPRATAASWRQRRPASARTVSWTAVCLSTFPGAALDSSETSIDASAARRLGELLTGTEAKQIADRLADGDTLTVALK